MPTKRTTHRSTAGKKLYAVRDEKGRFVDIQTYERAHRADLRKTHSKGDKKSRIRFTALPGIDKIYDQLVICSWS